MVPVTLHVLIQDMHFDITFRIQLEFECWVSNIKGLFGKRRTSLGMYWWIVISGVLCQQQVWRGRDECIHDTKQSPNPHHSFPHKQWQMHHEVARGNHRSMGVTKALFLNFYISKSCDPTKIPVIYFASYSYLTGVFAAKLRKHTSNMNVIFNS